MSAKAYYHLPDYLNFTSFTAHSCRYTAQIVTGFMTGVRLGPFTAHRRTASGEADERVSVRCGAREALALAQEYGVSARLTFSNSLLREKHLSDRKCNALCELFSQANSVQNGVIVRSELLTDYLRARYPALYLVSSTTKVLTDFEDFRHELDRKNFGMSCRIFD